MEGISLKHHADAIGFVLQAEIGIFNCLVATLWSASIMQHEDPETSSG